MKFLFRWTFRLVVLVTVLVVGLLLLKDTILEEVVEGQLAAGTGLQVRMDRLEAGILKSTLTLEGLRLYNPAEFGGAPLLHLREFHAEFDRAALARGKLVFRLLRVDLAELTLVQDASNRWNVQVVGERMQALSANRPTTVDFGGIDILNLSIGTVRQYHMNAPDNVKVYRFNLRNEIFPGLRSPADFLLAAGRLAVKLGLRRAMENTAANPPPSNLP